MNLHISRVTEEVCVSLEERTAMQFNADFFVGIAERINPGDKKHTITKITKVVSGSTLKPRLFGVYGSIVEAGIYKAPTLKQLRRKVIENTQRDINIALSMNLPSYSVNGNDTHEVSRLQEQMEFSPLLPVCGRSLYWRRSLLFGA